MHPFGAAVATGDIEGAIALLADNVDFRSPVVFRPYQGRDAVGVILRAVAEVFEDFRYIRELVAPDGRDHALVFEARVGDRHIEGSDFLRTGDDGVVQELTVMVRPLSAAHALADAMSAKLVGVHPPPQ